MQTTRCAEGEAALGDSDTFLGLGVGGVALAGAALIGMTVYLLLPTDPKAAATLGLLPFVGASNGVLLQGTF